MSDNKVSIKRQASSGVPIYLGGEPKTEVEHQLERMRLINVLNLLDARRYDELYDHILRESESYDHRPEV
jgi:hypothetical protein